MTPERLICRLSYQPSITNGYGLIVYKCMYSSENSNESSAINVFDSNDVKMSRGRLLEKS